MERDTTRTIYFIGIGGIGMSALARFFVHEGTPVRGSDKTQTVVTDGLQVLGVPIDFEQRAENITPDIAMVIYTEAMSPHHPEMVAARSLGVPMMNYFDALGMVANEYYLIAVAGTHGKTTTTSMITDVLEAAGFDPTAVIGSLRSKTKSNFRAGKSKYAVVEACEYKRDFLSLTPDVLVITNIELEHVDYYKDLSDVQSAFRQLVSQVREGGVVIANTTDPVVVPVIAHAPVKVLDYRPRIDATLPLRQPGLHNRMNATCARAVGEFLGIETATVTQALQDFSGTWRRFEYKGEVFGVPVYDDYGHHPTELRATFGGVRELYPDRKLIVVFQPHMYSRTHELFPDFVEVLALADSVYLLPIYGAREENISGITSEMVSAALATKGVPAQTCADIATTTAVVRQALVKNENSVIVVIGAGPVTAVAGALTNN